MRVKKQLKIWGSFTQFSAVLMLIAQLCASVSFAKAQPLSSEGQSWLRTAISTGNLPDLRWPDFSDYGKHVKKFYEFNGYSLWWVKGMEPTAQARQVIALMLQADQKGLS